MRLDPRGARTAGCRCRRRLRQGSLPRRARRTRAPDQPRSRRRILITDDLGFGELAIRQSYPSAGVILLSLYSLPQAVRAKHAVKGILDVQEAVAGHLAVIEPGRVRLRRLPTRKGEGLARAGCLPLGQPPFPLWARGAKKRLGAIPSHGRLRRRVPGQEARARPNSANLSDSGGEHGATADPGRDHRGADLRRRAAGPAALGRAAGRGRRGLPRDARDRGQDPGHLLGHGHRDREPARHRHGAGRRHRRHPPQHDAGGAGRAGGGGQALRRRHGGQPRHHPSRRHARRRAAPDGRAPHLRHSRGGAPARRASSSASSPTATCASPPTRGRRSPS